LRQTVLGEEVAQRHPRFDVVQQLLRIDSHTSGGALCSSGFFALGVDARDESDICAVFIITLVVVFLCRAVDRTVSGGFAAGGRFAALSFHLWVLVVVLVFISLYIFFFIFYRDDSIGRKRPSSNEKKKKEIKKLYPQAVEDDGHTKTQHCKTKQNKTKKSVVKEMDDGGTSKTPAEREKHKQVEEGPVEERDGTAYIRLEAYTECPSHRGRHVLKVEQSSLRDRRITSCVDAREIVSSVPDTKDGDAVWEEAIREIDPVLHTAARSTFDRGGAFGSGRKMWLINGRRSAEFSFAGEQCACSNTVRRGEGLPP
jgi:hypothetical protein